MKKVYVTQDTDGWTRVVVVGSGTITVEDVDKALKKQGGE
ncbi:hypothetical protein HNQ39_005110 [Armatimonas rosea]|uniref:Uncharacterized protein n=1 Tax=Armatimonas rosea TaxID=685828 RepID=A0A7W9SUX2_ARMRO|nr:hypothetical protein [Armatimonas rosea]